MTARLYEVTSTIMRDSFTRAFVSVHHVAAPTRQRAMKEVRDRLYLSGSDAVTLVAKCLGVQCQTKYRVLKESQA